MTEQCLDAFHLCYVTYLRPELEERFIRTLFLLSLVLNLNFLRYLSSQLPVISPV